MATTSFPAVTDDGSLQVTARLVVPSSEIEIRVTTSGGPGGQHANRSQTKVVASWSVALSRCLSESQRERLLAAVGPVVRSSASRFRSQSQNRQAALEQLAARVATALVPVTPRRPSKPTAASKRRRLDEKKSRARLKENRRRRSDD